MQNDRGLECLDKLIAGLSGAHSGTQSEGRCGLLEHIQAARPDLLGSMPGEYSLSLPQAEESVGCISDKNNRTEFKKALRTLIDSQGRDSIVSAA